MDDPKPRSVAKLVASPARYDVFQAVRILDRWLWLRQASGASKKLVDFVAARSLSFAYAPVANVELECELTSGVRVEVNFMGLLGSQGILQPDFRAMLLESEGEKARNTLTDFIRLLETRFIQRYLRAWEKSHLLYAYERAVKQYHDEQKDEATRFLYAVAGFASPVLRNRLSISDQTQAYFAAFLADRRRPPSILKQILEHRFGFTVKVREFVGEWLIVPVDKRTRLQSVRSPDAKEQDLGNSRLGATVLAGSRVWTLQNRVELIIGPVDLPTFQALLPGGRLAEQVSDVVRLYLDAALQFDMRIILKQKAVPPCCPRGASPDTKFTGEQAVTPPEVRTRLGRNSWLLGKAAAQSDRDDAVFGYERFLGKYERKIHSA